MFPVMLTHGTQCLVQSRASILTFLLLMRWFNVYMVTSDKWQTFPFRYSAHYFGQDISYRLLPPHHFVPARIAVSIPFTKSQMWRCKRIHRTCCNGSVIARSCGTRSRRALKERACIICGLTSNASDCGYHTFRTAQYWDTQWTDNNVTMTFIIGCCCSYRMRRLWYSHLLDWR